MAVLVVLIKILNKVKVVSFVDFFIRDELNACASDFAFNCNIFHLRFLRHCNT